MQNTKKRFSQNRSTMTYSIFAYDGSIMVYHSSMIIRFFIIVHSSKRSMYSIYNQWQLDDGMTVNF
jgi:hypothetical protein